MLASKLDKKSVHMPTIMKPTKRVADALQGQNPVFGAMLVNSSSKGFTGMTAIQAAGIHGAANQGTPHYTDNRIGNANNTQLAFGRPKTAGFMPEVLNGMNRP